MTDTAIQSHPYISVITINFNDCIGLERTIRSVISQTYSGFEYIIIDGGSGDGSKDIIEKYKNHFSYWVSEPDNGIYHAMNKGVKQAKGEYCLFLNSGDFLCNPNTLNIAAQELKVVGADICTGTLLCKKENYISGVIFPPKNVTLMLFKGGLEHQATFTKRVWLEKIPFAEDTKIVGDWQQFITCISINGASYAPIKCPISIYDTSGVSTLESNYKKIHTERKKFQSQFVSPWLLEEIKTILSSDIHLFTINKNNHSILFTLIKYIKKLQTQPAKYWYKIKYNKKLKESLQTSKASKEN